MPAENPDFFTTNMKHLKKNHPHIWEMMTKNPPEPEGDIIFAKNGEPNLLTHDTNGEKFSLHITENPGAEINDILNTVKEEFDGTLIITGMGLGYCPLALCENRDDLRHLIVFEPNAGFFVQALKAKNLTALFSDPRVILGIGEDQNIAMVMAPATKALQLEDIQHVQHNPSFALDFSKYNTLYEDINNHTSSANIEGNTFLKMGNDFFTNRLKHLSSIHHHYSFDDLSGIYKGLPAIIVSAGPSLDKNIHILKQAKNKAVILAVDSALPSLITNDIMPDFVTTIDPLELIYEKVANVANKVQDVSLICMSWVSSKMAKLFPADKIFWCFGGKPVEKWMADLTKCKTLTAGATSVAHLNFLSAIWMECSPIVFVGQDLSFSHSKSHSSDTTLPTNDLINDTLKNKKDIVWLDGVHGEKVPSNRGFHAHKRYFETMIKKQKGHYINSTENGCHIEGTIVMPLQEVIDTFCTAGMATKDVLTSLNKKDIINLQQHLISKLQTTIKRCLQVQKMLNQTSNLLNDLTKTIKKAEKLKLQYKKFNDLPKSKQKKIVMLDKIGKKLDNAHDIWPLMQEITMAGLRQSEKQKHAIDLLANDPEQYTQWLKKSFQRLNTINKVRKEILPLFQNTLQDDLNFLKSETTLFKILSKQKDTDKYNQQLLKLIRLYFDAGNIALAMPWLQKISIPIHMSPELNLFHGIAAAHYTEYDKAEAFFKQACNADPEYISQVEKFRESQGDAYVSYAPIFDKDDKTVARRLLLKGLIYAPNHKKVKQELKLRGNQSIKEINQHKKNNTLSEVEDMIDSWLKDLLSSKTLSCIIGNDITAQFYYYKGTLFLDREDIDNAIKHFERAVFFVPDNPKTHISLTDACFAKNDYVKGIEHLNQAVALDKVYAVYWEEIGDQLMQSEQYEDALTAFENCFTSLPQRVHLLKKIGDCYQKTGQLEAAREAYTKLNSLLKES